MRMLMQKSVLDYLETAAIEIPEKVAFTDSESQITYIDLMQKAKAVGSQITKRLAGQIRLPVIVSAHRNISTIIAFMGVVYSGNFYVPIDPKMPLGRKRSAIKTVKPALVLLRDNSDQFLEDLNYSDPKLILESCIHQEIDECKISTTRKMVIDVDPLFAIFTSGSTGVPKCVLINQRSVIKFTEIFTNIFDLSDDMVLGNQAPLDYDGSIKEICLTLKNRAVMHIIPKMLFSFPISLFEYLDQRKVNTLNWATASLKIIARHKALDTLQKPSLITRIFFTGEVMPNIILNYFRNHFPKTVFVNLYGPTETTFNCTYFVVNRAFFDDDVLPIGNPFPNLDIIILNEKNLPVKPGEIGEICVRGTSLGLGYYNNHDATRRSFVQNPLNKAFPDLIYRTGDLGKYNKLGELIFVSRMDHQIKHMGHRIELGEIEVAVNSLACVDVGCCLYYPVDRKIVLFYQSPKPCDLEIITQLKNQLPKYMLPQKLFHLRNLPTLNSGKIDRQKLRTMIN
jgi:amino acid adenylation domain-containing protein